MLVMDRDDVIDLLAIISTVDNRDVTDADILVWHEHLERFNKDDCLTAVMQHQQQSTAWLQPAHVVQRVRAMTNDRIERADPDDRPHLVGLNAPRDSYGYGDKSAGDGEYPEEWTAEQRVSHYWDNLRRQRDERERFTQGDRPASADVRAECMSHIRGMLHR